MSGRLRELFLGSKLRIALTVVLMVVGLLVAGVLTGVLGAPSVAGIENRFGPVNDTTTVIHTDLRVQNPNPIGVRLGGLTADYRISMNDIAMANGSKSGLGIGTGESTLSFTTLLYNDRIPRWWVSHLQNGEQTTLAVDASVHSALLGQSFGVPSVTRSIGTDMEAALDSTETRPIDADHPLVSDPLLYLNETDGAFGSVTRAETPIELTFTVYNPKSYAIPLGEIGYDITMNGIAVGSGESSRELVLPPKTTTTITTTTVIDNGHLDEWWVSHLEREQVTDIRIDLSARVDLTALGGDPIEIPLESITHTLETDFFGTKDADTNASAEPDTTATQTSGADGTSTATPGGETPTRTPTPPPTPTPTPTDDGILP